MLSVLQLEGGAEGGGLQLDGFSPPPLPVSSNLQRVHRTGPLPLTVISSVPTSDSQSVSGTLCVTSQPQKGA
jgi:hypothetical protein